MTFDAWIVLIIFFVTYIFILFFEKVQRTTAALSGAIVAMSYGMYRGFLSEGDSIGFIKFDIIILLMSMMIIVNVLMETGFFGYVALKLTQISHGNIGYLIILLGVGTAFLSMVVDNVTTIILFIPITIEISKKLDVSPVPFLLTEAILSNIGGVATMVGDPPNIIIASYGAFSFNDFLFHLLPPVLVIGVLVILYIRFLYKNWMCQSSSCFEDIQNLDPDDEITDPITMKKTLVILVCVFTLFIFHEHLEVSPAFIALAGACATLLVNYYDPEKVLKNVEWSALVFYASLFVLVGVLDNQGVFREVASGIIYYSNEDELVASLMILWIAGGITSCVDRISVTVGMAPVILHIGETGGMYTTPLFWALALGVGFGGNATPIGSATGIVTVGLASKFGCDISMKEWMKIGVPSVLISLVISTIFIVALWGFYY